MVPTPHKRGTDQRTRLMQVDNYKESAESNFAAVLATREKSVFQNELACWPALAIILRKHPNSRPEAIESIAYDAVCLG